MGAYQRVLLAAPSPRRRPAAGQRGPAAPLEARRDAGRRLLCLRADDKSSNSCPPSRAHPAPRSGQGGGALPPNRPGRGTTREGGAARLPRCPQVALHPGPEEAADGGRRSPAARGAAPGGGAHLQPAGAPPPPARPPSAPRPPQPSAGSRWGLKIKTPPARSARGAVGRGRGRRGAAPGGAALTCTRSSRRSPGRALAPRGEPRGGPAAAHRRGGAPRPSPVFPRRAPGARRLRPHHAPPAGQPARVPPRLTPPPSPSCRRCAASRLSPARPGPPPPGQERPAPAVPLAEPRAPREPLVAARRQSPAGRRGRPSRNGESEAVKGDGARNTSSPELPPSRQSLF